MLKATRALRAAEWSKTLHLPKSNFPPRPNLAERPKYLKQCADDLYAWQQARRPGQDSFVLHDGPPYANGGLHIGHSLNKILKDIICRFQVSQGKRLHYVPGWDCHGLPIEVKALHALGDDAKNDHRTLSSIAIRKAASKLAEKTIREQKRTFREWGIMGDWDNAYITMDRSFEVRQLQIFKTMVEKGLIYRQHKPVYWSPSSGTALAEAELEYDDQHQSLAAYVGFRLTAVPDVLKEIMVACNGALYALIWTTTPWTLPSNSAIAVHRSILYSVIRMVASDSCYIVASERIEDVVKVAQLGQFEIIAADIPGSDLAGAASYVPSLINEGQADQPIIHADFVSAASGTGLVHSSAGHGLDDYNVCKEIGLEAKAPVDDTGRFTRAVYSSLPESLDGIEVLDGGSEAVIHHLLALDAGAQPHRWQVVAVHQYKHKYPIDWRTKKPVIIRATAQWFADVGSIKEAALKAIEKVKFVPESGRARLQSFISGRSQWCISRQRAWGVPIPALYRVLDDGEHEAIMSPDSIQHIINTIESRGTNAWWTDNQEDPAWFHKGLPAGKYVRGRDTMDVWFDSGTTWTGLPNAFDASPPSDMVLEGSDQHRGWFQSSLLTYIASRDSSSSATAPRAPYKTLLTHGFTLDQEGRKMSKSLGNVISPSQIMDGSLLPPLKLKKKQNSQLAFDAMGPDVLRLWAASSDYSRDIVVGDAVLKSVTGTLHKLRVTLKWLLGVLSDVSPTTALTSPGTMQSSDARYLPERIALYNLQVCAASAHAAYESLEPYRVYQVLAHYLNQDLSAQWFEIAKDPLYAGCETERRTAQSVCYEILQQLLAIISPITPLLVQETLAHMPMGLSELLSHRDHHPFHRIWKPEHSVTDTPIRTAHGVDLMAANPGFKAHISALKVIHDQIKAAQEAARTDKHIGSGLECCVELKIAPGNPDTQAHDDLFKMLNDAQCCDAGLERMYVVSDIEISQSENLISAEALTITKQIAPDGAWQFTSVAPVAGALVKITVKRARHGKCPRCWQYKVEDTESADQLCHRCDSVVH